MRLYWIATQNVRFYNVTICIRIKPLYLLARRTESQSIYKNKKKHQLFASISVDPKKLYNFTKNHCRRCIWIMLITQESCVWLIANYNEQSSHTATQAFVSLWLRHSFVTQNCVKFTLACVKFCFIQDLFYHTRKTQYSYSVLIYNSRHIWKTNPVSTQSRVIDLKVFHLIYCKMVESEIKINC
jgi:hypothetical protein